MAARRLRCRQCGRAYAVAPVYVCADCLGPLEAVLEDLPNPEAIRAAVERGPRTLWRYEPLLPVAYDPVADLGAGMTPLVHARNLGATLGLRRLYLKNDGCNPTWSFKDRVVALGTAAARQFGFTVLACASTGNLANSVSAYAARAAMPAVVFVPAGLEAGKQVLSAVYGALIVEVNGTYDDVNRLCAQVADEYPWAFVNVNLRPYYSEGAKTLGYEVAEQLGWTLPDHVVVPLASGNLLVKIDKAFGELTDLGVVPRHTARVHGAQPEGCAPIAAAFEGGTDSIRPVRPQTAVHSLAIGNPADGRYALEAIRRSGGEAVAVSDTDAVQAVRDLAAAEGIFTETAGGVALAALRRLVQARRVDPDDLVVVYLTGMGLKTQETVAGALAPPVAIRPSLREFERAVVPALAERAASPAAVSGGV